MQAEEYSNSELLAPRGASGASSTTDGSSIFIELPKPCVSLINKAWRQTAADLSERDPKYVMPLPGASTTSQPSSKAESGFLADANKKEPDSTMISLSSIDAVLKNIVVMQTGELQMRSIYFVALI